MIWFEKICSPSCCRAGQGIYAQCRLSEERYCPNPTSSLSIPLVVHQDGRFPEFRCNHPGSPCVPFYGLARELEEPIESILRQCQS